MRLIATLLLAVAFLVPVTAGQVPTPSNATPPEASERGVGEPSNPPPAPEASAVIYTRPQALSTNEFWLSSMVLALGCVALGFAFILLRSREMSADDMIRLISVILIIIGTLFLITASFNAEQIAPAMGLFGTIAGYLLGKSTGVEIGRQEEKRDKGAKTE